MGSSAGGDLGTVGRPPAWLRVSGEGISAIEDGAAARAWPWFRGDRSVTWRNGVVDGFVSVGVTPPHQGDRIGSCTEGVSGRDLSTRRGVRTTVYSRRREFDDGWAKSPFAARARAGFPAGHPAHCVEHHLFHRVFPAPEWAAAHESVRVERLELSRPRTLEPKSCASASSATPARHHGRRLRCGAAAGAPGAVARRGSAVSPWRQSRRDPSAARG